jgi:tetratricopeptide (TPR) repeat protein
LEHALELDPENLGAIYFRGRVYMAQEEFDAALADLNVVVARAPDFPWGYFNRGITYLEQTNYDAAVTDFSRVIELVPDVPDGYYVRGYTYYEMGNNEGALADFHEYVRMVGSAAADPEVLQIIADLEGSGVPTSATGGARAAPFRIAPLFSSEPASGDPAAAYDEGIAFLQEGEYEQALDSFTRAIELDPAYADAYYIRGALSSFLADYDVAVADFTHVIELAPNFPDVYFDRGQAYYYQSDLTQAQADFDQYIELAGVNAAQERLDFIAQIERDQALVAGPAPTTAQGFYDRASAYNRLRDFDAAIADLTQALELDPDYTDAYVNRAGIHQLQENYQQAIADYTQALEQTPDDPVLYLARGSAYAALGDVENTARDFYQWLVLNEQRTIEEVSATLGEAFTVEMQEGSLFNVPFEAEEGQTITVSANDADGSGVDPLIVILDQDGNPLVADDDSGGGFDSLISDFELPAGGVYTLVIGHAGGGSEGVVEVTLE